MKRAAPFALVVALLDGCHAADGAAAPPQDRGVVDTVHSAEVSLGRFREGLSEPRAPLADGEPSLDALVERWVRAVETHDTTTIRRLVIDRAEFAWTYYPASTFSRRPLYQPPDLLWFRLRAGSEKGIVRVLRRLGGGDMRYRGVECARGPRAQGGNRIWEYCKVRREEEGSIRADILFGGILERDGRFKFISYANQY